ncbi:hypothetical protein JCGZ_09045 [Jatropha curcas]|uniref:Uncharacterized protein n=1 Tax=Jatropha curcas TaxID=180498 RepID=A0A067KHJ7_JATCU|nr:hypothetical protein JCGZ_09045 [Jatropha curcas]
MSSTRKLISVFGHQSSISHNLTTIKTSSDGAWQGDNPLNYAFPLLIVQTIIVLFVTRSLAYLLRPLRQPRVVAEIIGGILLGPSAFGRKKEFFQILFPSWSTPILESVASLELDLSTIRQSGKRAFGIAVAGISLPFLFCVGVSFILRKAIHVEETISYGPYLLFMGVSLSITAFPVLARILAELKLLTTHMGQTALAAAAFNDIAAWILLALAVALAGGDSKSPLISIWVLISGVAFVAFMMVVVQPMMNWVARKCSSQQDFVNEAYICLTLAGVMLSGFTTDLIGIHAIFGAFVFGLTIPKGGEFASRLTTKIEDFVSGLLLPLYFASSGLKTDVAQIRGVEAWGLLVLVISTACAGKILGTFAVAMLCMIPARESLALGVLMNTKGLVELIVLNIGKEKKVLDDEMFAILVLMALFTTFMTTPTVMAIYKPSRRICRVERQSPSLKNSQEQPMNRILACVHGPQNVKPLVNLISSTSTSDATKSSLKLYVMHLVQLTDCSSSIMMVQRTRKNGFPFTNSFCRGTSNSNDQIKAAFEACRHVNQLKIRHSTSVSALSTMHEDICHVAEDKSVAMIIMPFHKQWREGKEDEHGWIEINQKVLKTASCSVAIFIDRGLEGIDLETPMPRRICVLFFGGGDDRKALEMGGRMAAHPAISMTLIRFTVLSKISTEEESDIAAVEEFKRCNGSVEYIEKDVNNIIEQVVNIGRSGAFNLFIVGKEAAVAKLADIQTENAGLGLIGDILASSNNRIKGSVLVIQQNNPEHSNETTGSEIAKGKQTMHTNLSV